MKKTFITYKKVKSSIYRAINWRNHFVVGLPLGTITIGVTGKKKYKFTPMKQEEIITIDRDVLSGTPVFSGTRVPVSLVMRYFVLGWNIDEIITSFPTVKKQQIINLMDSLSDWLSEQVEE